MEASADVLVVDDDPTVSEVVAAYLRRCGHRVRLAADGPSAVASAHLKRPDLVVLDLMLPGFDGFEVYRRIRRLGPVPVIMLTARGEEHDRILGLELGADDYVTKPFSPRELSLRANSVLRRARHTAGTPDQAPDIRRVGDLEVDVTGHQATRAGEPLSLTGREFDLLAFLLAHPGQAFTRAELMQLVWGWDYGDQSTVTVHVRRLREKIEADPAQPRLLVTVWGVGYRLDSPEAQEQADRGEPARALRRDQAEAPDRTDGPHPSHPHSSQSPPSQSPPSQSPHSPSMSDLSSGPSRPQSHSSADKAGPGSQSGAHQ